MLLSQIQQLKFFYQKSIKNKLITKEQTYSVKKKYLQSLRDYIRIRFLLLENNRLNELKSSDDYYFNQISTKLLSIYKYQKAKVNKLFNSENLTKVIIEIIYFFLLNSILILEFNK